MEIIKLREDYIKLGQALKSGWPGRIRRRSQICRPGRPRIRKTARLFISAEKKLVDGDVVTYKGETIKNH